MIREDVEELGGNPLCAMIGGGRSAPDRAAFYNGALVRYLDFNDSYLAKGETCHPSDSIGAAVLDRPGRGVPGPVPALRSGPRAGARLRPHDPGSVRSRGRRREGAR